MSRYQKNSATVSKTSSPSGALLLSGLAIVAASYFGFVRPAQQHMFAMERQCNKLAIAVKKLQSKDDTARHGLRLITLLEEQSEKLASAESALNRFADLHERIIEESDAVAKSVVALDNLETVQADIVRYSKTLSNAANKLNEMADISASITTSITASGDSAREAQGSLVVLDEQHLELAGEITKLSEQLVTLELAVSKRSNNLPQAEKTLAQIDQLCTKLSHEAQTLNRAQVQLSKLANLKQEVIEQAVDIPAAMTTLDQVWDLKAGLQQATDTINKAKGLTVDMMLLEPVLDRVAKSLKPVSEATRLSRREAAKAPKTRHMAEADEPLLPLSDAIEVFVALLGAGE